jgi:cytochrome P450
VSDSVVDRPTWNYTSNPELLRCPWDEWNRLREESRAFSSSEAAPDWNVWTLMRNEDVRQAMRQPELFSSRSVLNVYSGPKLIDPHEAAAVQRMIPEELDPPEHTKYRQVLTPLFSPQAVEGMETAIRAWCVELIEGFLPNRRCDLNRDFARQFPTMIFLRMMGQPEGGADEFLRTVNERTVALAGGGDATAQLISGAYLMTTVEYMNRLLDERRAKREDDIVSYLLDAEIDGRKLDDAELNQICTLLFAAGLDTVAGQLGFMFHHLAVHESDRRLVVEQPELIPGAVEEVLRMYSIVATNRIVTRDVEFAGCPMKAGDRVIVGMPAAGRDPREFPDPDRFDPTRPVNRHLAFGAGPHRCLGSHLARLELQVALEEWHRLIPEYQLEDPDAVRFHAGGVAGVDTLPLAW